MNPNQKRSNAQFLEMIGSQNPVKKIDAFDGADTVAPQQNTQGMVMPSIGAGLQGNPNWASTFNLQFLRTYYTLNAGAYTKIDAATLNAALQNRLPFFIFGNNDFNAGFAKIKGSFPVNSNWQFGVPFIYGKDADEGGLALDAVVEGDLQAGDLVIPFTSALPGAGTTTLALSIVRCPETQYGNLLSELSSDRFVIGGIRYTINDTTKIDQYSNQIQFNNLSIFGKFDNDKLTPNDYKQPTQFQNGIIDIPVPTPFAAVDKHKSWGFYGNYDVIIQSWVLFAPRVTKLSA